MGVSLSGLEEPVDRCEGEVGELEVEGAGLPPDPPAERFGQPDGDPVLGATDGGEGHRLAAIEGLDQLAEGALVDQPHTAARVLAGIQALGGVEHVLVEAFRQEEAEFFCGWGHRNTHAYG
ncbi:hypothetical protein [Phenylobacterium aquaticum]|uniref:hypothetical protein n=1 Tax=Phenylobacterium aquaticum TaxID=1763816 RepID=UPI001F5C382B|nr:hypothetical protein [Phenylobacterium aquaticum]MCI3130987.1 hypothetical protein [Phenylobacterium aquaticum]